MKVIRIVKNINFNKLSTNNKILSNSNILAFNQYKTFCNLKKLAESIGIKDYTSSKGLNEEFNSFNYEIDIYPINYILDKNFPYLQKNTLLTTFNKEKKFFLPNKFGIYIKRVIDIKYHLKSKYKFTESEATECIFCVPYIAYLNSSIIIRNIDNIFQLFNKYNKDTNNHNDNFKNLITEYPKLMSVIPEKLDKIISYMSIYFQEEEFKLEDIEKLVIQNPLTATADPENVQKLIEYMLKIKSKSLLYCNKNINSNKGKKLMKKLYDDEKSRVLEKEPWLEVPEYNVIEKKTDIEREVLNKFSQIHKLLFLRPELLFFSAEKFNDIFTCLKEKLGIDYYLTLYLISKCPDIILSNRNGLLEKKIDMLLQLDIDRYTLKQMIKHYPFALLKSFNSYIKKHKFLTEFAGFNLSENKEKINNTDISLEDKALLTTDEFEELNKLKVTKLDLYPYILLFDFHKEIKPKIFILKDIEKKKILKEKANKIASFASNLKERDFEDNRTSIDYNEAFSLTKEEFCQKVNCSIDEYDQISKEEYNKSIMKNKYNIYLEERDLIFSYSKYTYY